MGQLTSDKPDRGQACRRGLSVPANRPSLLVPSTSTLTVDADEPASQGTRVSRMKKFHLNAGNSGVQLLRSTYSGTLQYTHSKFANRTAAVTRNTQRTPKAAATAPPESGPIELPRNIAEAVMP